MLTKGKRISGEERRQQIMEASLDLFAEKGFKGTRTKDIAEQIGISETLIFQHFSTKEELYWAVLKQFIGGHPIQPEIEDIIAARKDREFFYVIARHFLKHSNQDARIIRLALFQALEGSYYDHLSSLRNKEKNPRLYEIICDYIQIRIEENAFQQVNVRAVSKIFLEALLMHVINKELNLMDSLNSISDEETAAALVDIFLSALKKNNG